MFNNTLYTISLVKAFQYLSRTKNVLVDNIKSVPVDAYLYVMLFDYQKGTHYHICVVLYHVLLNASIDIQKSGDNTVNLCDTLTHYSIS